MMLKERTSFYKVCFDSMQMGIVVLDSSRSITITNTSILKIFGYTDDELYEKSVNHIIEVSPLTKKWETDPHPFHNGQTYELKGKHKSGRIIDIAVVFGMLYFEEKPFYKLFITNLHLKKSKEKELIELNKKLKKEVKERNKELDRLIAQFKKTLGKESEIDQTSNDFVNMVSNELMEPVNSLLEITSAMSTNKKLINDPLWQKHVESFNIQAQQMRMLMERLYSLYPSASTANTLESTNIHEIKSPIIFSQNFQNVIRDFDQYLNRKKVYHFKKGSSIYCQGNRSNHIFLIRSGHVKTYKLNDAGKELITGFYSQNDYFGYVSFVKDSVHDENATAISKMSLYKIGPEEIRSIVSNNHQIVFEFIGRLANDLKRARDRMLLLSYGSVRKRTAEALLYLADAHPKSLNNQLYMQRPDLASFVGIAKETLIRTLHDFKEEKLVRIDPKFIEITDKQSLMSVC